MATPDRWHSWLKHHPHQQQKAVDLIPNQGINVGCGFHPQTGTYGRQLIDVSLSISSPFSLPPYLSLKINKKLSASERKCEDFFFNFK